MLLWTIVGACGILFGILCTAKRQKDISRINDFKTRLVHSVHIEVRSNVGNDSDSQAFQRTDIIYLPSLANVTLKCVFESRPADFPPATEKVILWFNNGQLINNTNLHASADDQLFLTNSTTKELEGEFRCKVELVGYGVILSPSTFINLAGLENQRQDKKLRRVQGVANSVSFIPCLAPIPKPSHAAKYWFTKDEKFVIDNNLDRKYFLAPHGLQIMLTPNYTDDIGNYTCYVQNTINGKTYKGKTVHLAVKDNEKNKTKVKILAPNQKQTDLSATVGQDVTMECVMSGQPAPQVVWEKYGGVLPENKHHIVFDNLILTNISKQDEGSYLCKAEAAPNVDLSEYRQLPFIVYSLIVYESIRVKISFEASEKNDNAYQLSCESNSGSSNDITILYNGQNLLSNPLLKVINVNMNEGSRKPKWEVLLHKASILNGIYQCIVSNKAPNLYSESGSIFVQIANGIVNETSTAMISVQSTDLLSEDEVENDVLKNDDLQWPILTKDAKLPTIFQAPENATDFESSTVTFVCQISGEDVNVFWLKDNRGISIGGKYDILGSGTLEIRNVSADDEGWYTCIAVNSAGNISAKAYLNVESPAAFDFDGDAMSQDGQQESDRFNGQKNGAEERNHEASVDDEERELLVDHGEESTFADDKVSQANGTLKTYQHRIHNLLKQRMKAPEVYRLTNSSVMLKWELPDSSLVDQRSIYDLQFRVQYKLASRNAKWTTIDGTFPGNVQSFTIDNLTPGNKYKFRIGGFYNNVNFMSKVSSKFLLQQNTTFSAKLAAPTLLEINSSSPSTLHIFWTVVHNDHVPINGFIISYKKVYPPGYSSGQHPPQNDTVTGGDKREHVLRNLLPATPYEIRISAFNLDGPGQMSNSMVQTTRTSDGHFSPLSFVPPVPKEILSGNQIANAKKSDKPFDWKFDDLNRGTIFVLIGCTLALITILAIISSIAWTVTNRQQKKSIAKGTKKKFTDTSKKIHYEFSFCKSKKKLGGDAAGSFYAAHLPEYDSLNNLDNITHSESDNCPSRPNNEEKNLSSQYTSATNCNSSENHVVNLYSNPFEELDKIVESQTLPDTYGGIGSIGKKKPELPRTRANDLLLCKSVLDSLPGGRACSVASFHSDRSTINPYNLRSQRFLTLCSQNRDNAKRRYSPTRLNDEIEDKSDIGTSRTLQASRTMNCNRQFRSPSPRVPKPVPTPELNPGPRIGHCNRSLLKSDMAASPCRGSIERRTTEPSPELLRFDFLGSSYLNGHQSPLMSSLGFNQDNTHFNSPRLHQHYDSPNSLSACILRKDENWSPVLSTSKQFCTFKPQDNGSPCFRNSNNSNISHSFYNCTLIPTDDQPSDLEGHCGLKSASDRSSEISQKTLDDSKIGDESEALQLSDWSEHILRLNGFYTDTR